VAESHVQCPGSSTKWWSEAARKSIWQQRRKARPPGQYSWRVLLQVRCSEPQRPSRRPAPYPIRTFCWWRRVWRRCSSLTRVAFAEIGVDRVSGRTALQTETLIGYLSSFSRCAGLPEVPQADQREPLREAPQAVRHLTQACDPIPLRPLCHGTDREPEPRNNIRATELISWEQIPEQDGILVPSLIGNHHGRHRTGTAHLEVTFGTSASQ